MSPLGWLWWSLAAMAGLTSVLLVGVCVRRTTRHVGDLRRQRAATVIRPQLLEWLAEDDPDPADLPAGTRQEERALKALACDLLPKLRGHAHASLRWLLERHGVAAVELRRIRRPGVVGRGEAAALLGLLQVTAAYDDLVRLLGARRPELRIVAARALGNLGVADAGAVLLLALDGPRAVPSGAVSRALLRLDDAAVEPARVALADPSAIRRAVAAEVLGHLPAVRACSDLEALVRSDPDVQVRVRAARSLGRLGHPRSTQALIDALAAPHPPRLRAAAACALGALGDAGAVLVLGRALDADDHRVATAAAGALSELGQDGVRLLARAARQPGLGAAHARSALVRMTLARGGPALRRRTA